MHKTLQDHGTPIGKNSNSTFVIWNILKDELFLIIYDTIWTTSYFPKLWVVFAHILWVFGPSLNCGSEAWHCEFFSCRSDALTEQASQRSCRWQGQCRARWCWYYCCTDRRNRVHRRRKTCGTRCSCCNFSCPRSTSYRSTCHANHARKAKVIVNVKEKGGFDAKWTRCPKQITPCAFSISDISSAQGTSS